MGERIPTIGIHRGIGLHDSQSAERLKTVKAAIDQVAGISDIMELVAFAANPRQPPEARLFAGNKIETLYALAAERRENRPSVDLDYVRALVAGLDSVGWRSPTHYCSLLELHHEQAVERETPLPEEVIRRAG